MITLPQLKTLLKEHKISNTTHLNKDEIIALLIDKVLSPRLTFYKTNLSKRNQKQ